MISLHYQQFSSEFDKIRGKKCIPPPMRGCASERKSELDLSLI